MKPPGACLQLFSLGAREPDGKFDDRCHEDVEVGDALGPRGSVASSRSTARRTSKDTLTRCDSARANIRRSAAFTVLSDMGRSPVRSDGKT